MNYINKFTEQIVNPAILFLFALALVYFLYGMVMFIKNADDEKARNEGKQNMIWGIVGLFIMVGVYGILRIIIGTVGASVPDTLQKHL